MRSLISYYGGKQNLSNKILPYFPQHKVYVEPFAGGAALLFAKPKPKINANFSEVLNDINNHIVTLYRIARTQPEELKRYLQLTPYSQYECRRAKDILKRYFKRKYKSF